MGRFAEKHPQQLKEIVGRAIANGQTAAETHRQLLAGTLAGWDGPYQMPLETVRYCGKVYKRKRQARTISPEAAQDAKQEVDRLARLLLTAAQRGVEQSVARTEPDRKALKEWADALKGIQALVSESSSPDKPVPKTKRTRPTDPLTTRLLANTKTPDQTPKPANNNTNPTQPNNTNTNTNGGVAADTVSGPQSAAWRPAA